MRGEGKGRMSDGGVFGSEVLSCQDLLLFMSKLSLFPQLCELFIFSLLSNMSSHLIIKSYSEQVNLLNNSFININIM